MKPPKCRFCGSNLVETFIDLGVSPLANSYLEVDDLGKMEPFYPLHAFVCGDCLLVQLPEYESPQEIFGEYAYFSSYSDSWLEHARNYAEQVIQRFDLNENSCVIEVGSNDGYLLQYFLNHGIRVLGIDPAENVAAAAEEKGIPTVVEFFGISSAQRLVQRGYQADLLIGNNVLAHVPDINDFIGGLKLILASQGVLTMEFPHLVKLIEQNQFDTIYHEHFSYFTFITVEKIFAEHGLKVFDVEEISTHGGSLRIFVCQEDNASLTITDQAEILRDKEMDKGFGNLSTYLSFQSRAFRVKHKLLLFLIDASLQGKRVVGYGAPAKGNTLLNYCGIRTDLVDYTVDRNPHKQNRFLPGTHIPIYSPEHIRKTEPDYILILPWNLKDEIIGQLADVREWGCEFLVPIPELEIL